MPLFYFNSVLRVYTVLYSFLVTIKLIQANIKKATAQLHMYEKTSKLIFN